MKGRFSRNSPFKESRWFRLWFSRMRNLYPPVDNSSETSRRGSMVTGNLSINPIHAKYKVLTPSEPRYKVPLTSPSTPPTPRTKYYKPLKQPPPCQVQGTINLHINPLHAKYKVLLTSPRHVLGTTYKVLRHYKPRLAQGNAIVYCQIFRKINKILGLRA